MCVCLCVWWVGEGVRKRQDGKGMEERDEMQRKQQPAAELGSNRFTNTLILYKISTLL